MNDLEEVLKSIRANDKVNKIRNTSFIFLTSI